ncbi:centrosomal protein of 70 kDa isoform X2 [Rana temporaria]|uniref:centrosomal protein of 70 kDa isoform X2 n=1 Tax=Rana temporaria TaxID=8407 RepID=UPI001AADB500|nr:centrosomal protein of 70 kDa isoform X2 [Rana temporaria]
MVTDGGCEGAGRPRKEFKLKRETPEEMEISEWENINKLLKRHGCGAVNVSERDDLPGGVGLDSQASQALRSAIRSLVEDTERRQNLIHGLIQTNNQLKEDARLQQDRAGRQEQRANELQRILDGVRTKIRDLEDDFISKMRQQQTEMTNLLQEKKVVHDRCQKNKEKLREQEENITQLRKRLSQLVRSEEQRAANQKKSFLRLMNREPRENNILDQQVLDVIDDYERRVNHLQTELRRYEGLDVPVLERRSSEESLDLDTTPNYKALIKSYQEQIKEARRRNEELVRENDQIRREMESRPSAKEFRLYKQQMRKMEKILLQNNIQFRGMKKEKREESRGDAESTDLLPAAECQLHLQDLCRELNVLDLKDLVPTATSNLRQAQTSTKLHKILCDINSVISGPRAPQLLYKHHPRGDGTSDEADFIHILPTVELWAGQLLSLKALHRALRKMSEKLLPDQTLNKSQEPSDGVRVEELLLLVDTMLEDLENRKQGGAVISPYTLQALVSHFQNLFDVPSLNGVYPRMNEVYSRLGEVTNAMKNLRNILGLDDGAGIGTVVNAVWGMCRNAEGGNRQKLQDVLGPLDIDSIINKIQEHEEFFPAFEDLVKGLLDILEIRHLEEILPEVLRLKTLGSR